jgi:ankyrin repeat protein
LLSVATPAVLAAQGRNEKLFDAARAGDAAAVKALLDRGIDLNTKFRHGATALS